MTPNGYDEPNFNKPAMCVHCADFEDCESVEDSPVCAQCFEEFYNEDWTLKITDADVSFEPHSRISVGGAAK